MSGSFALLVDAYLDDALDERQADELLAYLQSSPGAREHLRRIAAIDHGLRSLAGTTLDGQVARLGVLARVRHADDGRRLRHAVEGRLRLMPPHRATRRRHQHIAWPGLAAAALLVVLIVGGLLRLPAPALAPDAVAVVEAVSGWVSLGPAVGVEGDDHTTAVVLGQSLRGGERIIVGDQGAATLRLHDGTRLDLGAGSRAQVPADDGARIRLDLGTVAAQVTPQALDAPALISLPDGRIRVLGTEFTISVASDATQVRVTDGVVSFERADGRRWQVSAGESLRFAGGRAQRSVLLDLRSAVGQPWVAHAARTLRGMSIIPSATTPPLDSWGGRSDRVLAGPGRFRVQHDGERWWTVDPAGHAAVMTGVGIVRQTSGSAAARRQRADGSYADWAVRVGDLLSTNGFNLIGIDSDPQATAAIAARRGRGPARLLTWTVAEDFAKAYVDSNAALKDQADSQAIVQALAPLLPAFADAITAWVPELTSTDAPDVLGVLTDRTLPIGFSWRSLRRVATADQEIGRCLARWMQQRQRTWDSLDDQDLSALRQDCLRGYRDQVCAGVRRAAPQVLLFGPAMGVAPRGDEHAEIIAKAVDVLTVYVFGRWLPDPAELVQLSQRWRKPLYVDGIYAKGADSGLPNRDGSGPEVRTQADRARYYQHLALVLLESRVVIGWQWYRLDNGGDDHSDRNEESNKGLIDAHGEPYRVLLSGMEELHRLRYALIDQLDHAGR